MLKTRTHVVLPAELVAQIDSLVGKRRRSAFIAEALEERLRRERLLAAAQRAAGSIKDGEVPDWDTPESAYAWVRGLRDWPDRWEGEPGASP